MLSSLLLLCRAGRCHFFLCSSVFPAPSFCVPGSLRRLPGTRFFPLLFDVASTATFRAVFGGMCRCGGHVTAPLQDDGANLSDFVAPQGVMVQIGFLMISKGHFNRV